MLFIRKDRAWSDSWIALSIEVSKDSYQTAFRWISGLGITDSEEIGEVARNPEPAGSHLS
ncbi:hypothetical protein D920_00004 [Enterococcus faecalis 13-SD-W-01]|nr:hypothetical protein D920_00004 [Enterococcus faecalis 13-SD-W-01]